MPTLLRVALGAIPLALNGALIAVLALTAKHAAEVPLLVSTVAAPVLWLPPMMGGLLVSYWSWSDEPGRRAARRTLVVLAALSLLSGAALIVGAALGGAPLLPSIVLAVVGWALLPAALRVGSIARRLDAARGIGARDDPARAAVVEDVRRGRIHGLIGAGIGLVLALVVVMALTLLTARPDRQEVLSSALVFVVALVLIGAASGRTTAIFRLARRQRAVLGSDWGTGRAVGRAIRGKAVPLTADQEQRAARLAPIALASVSYQFTSSLLLLGGIAAVQVGQLRDGLGGLHVATLTFLVAGTAVILPVGLLQRRRMAAFAAAHPVPAA